MPPIKSWDQRLRDAKARKLAKEEEARVNKEEIHQKEKENQALAEKNKAKIRNKELKMNYGRVGRPEAKSTVGGNGQTSRPIDIRNATTMGPSDGTMHPSTSAAAAQPLNMVKSSQKLLPLPKATTTSLMMQPVNKQQVGTKQSSEEWKSSTSGDGGVSVMIKLMEKALAIANKLDQVDIGDMRGNQTDVVVVECNEQEKDGMGKAVPNVGPLAQTIPHLEVDSNTIGQFVSVYSSVGSSNEPTMPPAQSTEDEVVNLDEAIDKLDKEQEHQEEVNRIKEELEGKKEQIVKLEQSLAQAENARKVAEQKLEEQIATAKKKQAELEAELKSVTEWKDKFAENNEALRQTVRELTEKNDKLEAKNAELTAKNDKLEAKIAELVEKNDNSEAGTSQQTLNAPNQQIPRPTGRPYSVWLQCQYCGKDKRSDGIAEHEKKCKKRPAK